ncbi:MAG: mercuric reductase [Acidobacteria bacterium]|nr:mercuric reductase [Acidobacteriota bacterium]
MSTAVELKDNAQQNLVRPDDQHNRTLLANVHPPDWTNPTPSARYNLLVLGAGTAGLVSAAGAAGLGAKVALVERHFLGGDCLNYGCVPSKAVIRAARAAYASREAADFGVRLEGSLTVDFGQAMERMRRLRAGISRHDSAQRFTSLGVDVFLGNARFLSPEVVEVGGQRLKFSRAVIATGARAAELPVPGLKEAGYLTNETVFSLTELPKRLLVIGAGPIGCELAQAFRRLGSEVTLLTDGKRIMPREDADAATLVQERFRREGIEMLFEARIARAENRDGSKVLLFDRGRGEEQVSGTEILVAVGRAPNLEGLNLEAAGVNYDRKGVVVNDRLQTANSRIYAAGDICSQFKFTHAADAMARIVLQNALFFGRKKASALVIPWCTYTDPEIAHVGLYEDQARARGYDIATYTIPLAEVDRAILDGDQDGFARIVAEKKKGRVLGATLVARHAGESIGEMVLAIQQGLGLGTIAQTIHPYPTQAEILKRAGDGFNRGRLTPRVRRLFEAWFRWMR